MSGDALAMLLLVQVPIAAITIYLYVKVLKSKKPRA
jgi:hypothetical protein